MLELDEYYNLNKYKIAQQNLIAFLGHYTPLFPNNDFAYFALKRRVDIPDNMLAFDDMCTRQQMIFKASAQRIDNSLSVASNTAASLIMNCFDQQVESISGKLRYLLHRIIKHYIDFGFVVLEKKKNKYVIYNPIDTLAYISPEGEHVFVSERLFEKKRNKVFARRVDSGWDWAYGGSVTKRIDDEHFLLSPINDAASGILSLESQLLANYYTFLITYDVDYAVLPPLSDLGGSTQGGVGKIFPMALNEAPEDTQPFLCQKTYERSPAIEILRAGIELMKTNVIQSYNIEMLREDPSSLEVVHTMAYFLSKVLANHGEKIKLRVAPSKQEVMHNQELFQMIEMMAAIDPMVKNQFNARPILEQLFKKYGFASALLNRVEAAQKLNVSATMQAQQVQK